MAREAVDVLCVGAHPDDVELAIGGAVAAMVREGLRVAICDLTDGEPTPCGTSERRRAEAEQAAGKLGVGERRILPFPNRWLTDGPAPRRALAEAVRELRPHTMLIPYPVDWHPDHGAASAIGIAGRFLAKLVKTELQGEPHYPARLLYFGPVHARLHIKPAFILDITQTIDIKMAALSCYRSQFIDNSANVNMPQQVREQNAYFGSLIHKGYGEPIYSSEEIGLRSIASLC